MKIGGREHLAYIHKWDATKSLGFNVKNAFKAKMYRILYAISRGEWVDTAMVRKLKKKEQKLRGRIRAVDTELSQSQLKPDSQDKVKSDLNALSSEISKMRQICQEVMPTGLKKTYLDPDTYGPSVESMERNFEDLHLSVQESQKDLEWMQERSTQRQMNQNQKPVKKQTAPVPQQPVATKEPVKYSAAEVRELEIAQVDSMDGVIEKINRAKTTADWKASKREYEEAVAKFDLKTTDGKNALEKQRKQLESAIIKAEDRILKSSQASQATQISKPSQPLEISQSRQQRSFGGANFKPEDVEKAQRVNASLEGKLVEIKNEVEGLSPESTKEKCQELQSRIRQLRVQLKTHGAAVLTRDKIYKELRQLEERVKTAGESVQPRVVEPVVVEVPESLSLEKKVEILRGNLTDLLNFIYTKEDLLSVMASKNVLFENPVSDLVSNIKGSADKQLEVIDELIGDIQDSLEEANYVEEDGAGKWSFPESNQELAKFWNNTFTVYREALEAQDQREDS